MPRLSTVLTFLCFTIAVNASFPKPRPPIHKPGWVLSETFIGEHFLDNFIFEAIDDPTHGRVNYVNATIAKKERLVSAKRDSFTMRADSKTVLSAEGPGRNSVRLRSNNQYTTSVMVFDIQHMPEGCGTWPAVWTVGAPWPHLGEIDIVEGVNNLSPNSIVLHTTDGCDMPADRIQTGNADKHSCGNGNDYIGCPVKVNDNRSFGPAFNKNRGGWYAMERTETSIKVWFWPRSARDVPLDVRSGSRRVDTRKWGIPAANYYTNEGCSIAEKFGPHWIVINLTFCGDWAGNAYGQSGCPSTCIDYVDNNPAAFKNAYFEFNSIRVYKNARIDSGASSPETESTDSSDPAADSMDA